MSSMTEVQKKRTKWVLTITPVILGVFVLLVYFLNPRMTRQEDVGLVVVFGIAMIVIGLAVMPVWRWVEEGKKR